MASTIRDQILAIQNVQIPRPTVQGFQWVQTRGRNGFYKSIRAHGDRYGLAIRPQGPRRPALSQDIFQRPETVQEEESSDGTVSPTQPAMRQNRSAHSVDSHRSSSSSQISSDGSRRSSPDPEPDYPSDYVPPQLPPPRLSAPRMSAPPRLTHAVPSRVIKL